MKEAAGLLLYRRRGATLEVILVHPSGDARRDKPWSIPKGLPDDGESLEETARRETAEEAGVTAAGLPYDLGSIQYTTKSRKVVHAFAGPAPDDAEPHAASWEVDRAEFVSIDQARRLLHPDQVPLVERLVAQLDHTA